MSESGQTIRQARAARARLIRRRVATGAVTLFVGAWALIAFELVTGHDPALAAHKSSSSSSGSSATATSVTSSSDGSTSSGGSSGSDGSTSSDGSSGSASQSISPSAVTTQQS